MRLPFPFRSSALPSLPTDALRCPVVPRPPSVRELQRWQRHARRVHTLLIGLGLMGVAGLSVGALLCDDPLLAAGAVPIGLMGLALLVRWGRSRSLHRHQGLDWPEHRRVEALARTLPGAPVYLEAVHRVGRSLVTEDADRLQRYRQALDRWRTADAEFAAMSAEQHALRLARYPDDATWWHGFRAASAVAPTSGQDPDAHNG